MATIRAVFVIVGLTLLSLALIPLQLIALGLKRRKMARTLPLLWHRAATRLIGIRIHQHGTPSPDRPLLVVANHVSWLDITVLGALMPLSFIAKSEVATWPVFGLFAKLQRSVFVERERRAQTGHVAKTIADRLSGGDVLVLFAEGTSSNGIHVLPFRTALVGGAAKAISGGDTVTVQPLAVNYTQLHGLPIGRFHKPRIAWYGDMEMASHLWWVLKHGEIDVDVAWGDALPFGDGADRKQTARTAEETVRRLMGEATAGRLKREPA
ncbi:MAG: lysophospholipid acyltransferase family protein [Pseudomonadota bacterium]